MLESQFADTDLTDPEASRFRPLSSGCLRCREGQLGHRAPLHLTFETSAEVVRLRLCLDGGNLVTLGERARLEVCRLGALFLDVFDYVVERLKVGVESVSVLEGGDLDLFHWAVKGAGGVALGVENVSGLLDHFLDLHVLAGLVQKVERGLELFTLFHWLEVDDALVGLNRMQASACSPLHIY